MKILACKDSGSIMNLSYPVGTSTFKKKKKRKKKFHLPRPRCQGSPGILTVVELWWQDESLRHHLCHKSSLSQAQDGAGGFS